MREKCNGDGGCPFEAKGEIEMLWKLLQSVTEWVRHAESKLGAIIAFSGAGLAVAISVGSKIEEAATTWGTVWFLSAVIATALSAVSSILGLMPRTEKKSPTVYADASPVYFGDIARSFESPNELEGALIRVGSGEGPSYKDLIIEQIYENSRVASLKYFWAKVASASLGVEVISIVLLAGLFGLTS